MQVNTTLSSISHLILSLPTLTSYLKRHYNNPSAPKDNPQTCIYLQTFILSCFVASANRAVIEACFYFLHRTNSQYTSEASQPMIAKTKMLPCEQQNKKLASDVGAHLMDNHASSSSIYFCIYY